MLHVLLEFIGEEQRIYSPDITFYRPDYYTCWIGWFLLMTLMVICLTL